MDVAEYGLMVLIEIGRSSQESVLHTLRYTVSACVRVYVVCVFKFVHTSCSTSMAHSVGSAVI